MYSKDATLNTVRGPARVIATREEPHIVNGAHPTVPDGGELFPEEGKDYVVEFVREEQNQFLKTTYVDYTHSDLSALVIQE